MCRIFLLREVKSKKVLQSVKACKLLIYSEL